MFHQNLHGYRDNRSTQTALITMYDRWVQAASLGKISGVILLDLSSAFDLVDHDYLLKKLQIYGIQSDSLQWIDSYLKHRRQAVWIDNVLSEFLDCEIGVPQGSNLGPLFFLIYFNDLLHTVECSIDSYADDTTLTSSGNSTQEIEEKLKIDCDSISTWMKSNLLKLNPEKTHLLTTGTTKRLSQVLSPLTVQMDNVALKEDPSQSECLLGVIIESTLKWNKQLSALKVKLAQRLYGLNQVKFICPFNVRKIVAEGSFNSVLAYCLPLFGGLEKYQIQELQVLQNKAARIVCRAAPRSNRLALFSKLKWFTVNQLICYYTLLVVFKVRKSRSPEYLADILCKDSRNGRIQIPNIQLTLAYKSFCFRGAQQYNLLPSEIRFQDKIGAFKKLVKRWIADHVPAFLE